jgi:hypothetical protein
MRWIVRFMHVLDRMLRYRSSLHKRKHILVGIVTMGHDTTPGLPLGRMRKPHAFGT